MYNGIRELCVSLIRLHLYERHTHTPPRFSHMLILGPRRLVLAAAFETVSFQGETGTGLTQSALNIFKRHGQWSEFSCAL